MNTKKKLLICCIPLLVVVVLLFVVKWKGSNPEEEKKITSVNNKEIDSKDEKGDNPIKENDVENTKLSGADKLEFVQNMGNGINIGNSLDATNHDPSMFELCTETCWNNPRITSELLKAVHEAGFKTVRIPVTFEEHMDKDYQISEVWMERVKEVIDMALDEGLYVIMDTHHEGWLSLKLDEKERIKSQLKSVWTQIALCFRDYDEHLLFEGMNEPRLQDTSYEWTDGTPKLRDFVNELNRVFVDTVRESGGNNKERFLLIATYCNQPWKGATEGLLVPEGNVIVSVHMYSPFEFCLSDEGTSKWSADNSADTIGIDDAFVNVYNTFIKQGIPVILTEYGCDDKNNLEDRVAFASYYSQKSKQYQVPLIWWDAGHGCNLIDRSNYSVVYPEIVEVIR